MDYLQVVVIATFSPRRIDIIKPSYAGVKYRANEFFYTLPRI